MLYFEGDRHASYRILRGVKNRFGSTNEIGVFEMREEGLVEVENPSEFMLAGKTRGSIRFRSSLLHGGNQTDPDRNPGTCMCQQLRHAEKNGSRYGL